MASLGPEGPTQSNQESVPLSSQTGLEPPLSSVGGVPPEPFFTDIQYTSVADIPSERDMLGFRPYVEAMATFLANEKTVPPLTLSIEGEWGSGKSSFMLQLQKALDARLGKKARFVQFNAWRHEQGEALWSAFALEFSRQLAPRNLLVRAWKRLSLGLSRLRKGQGWLTFLKFFIPLLLLGVAGYFSLSSLQRLSDRASALIALLTAPLSVPLIKKVWDFFGNPFSVDLSKLKTAPDYESHKPFIEQFHEDFRMLMAHYASSKEKIFVFVDDLDRCEVPKAAELLQAMNLMIPENSKVIFLLGLDRKKVAAGIAMRNEKLLPLLAPPAPGEGSRLPFDPGLAANFGRDFLERFIQLPFQVPQPTPDRLDGMLDHLLGRPEPELTMPVSGKTVPDGSPPSLFQPGPDASPMEAPTPYETAIIQRAETDSPQVRALMKMIAPSLGFNPRRLKQFLNVFRLTAYIAHNTGLFRSTDPKTSPPLTLQQLGKFVVIGLRWPGLLEDIEEEPLLLLQLEEPGAGMVSPMTAYWRARPELRKLLIAGLEGPARREHSLAGLDFRRLRSVSPAIPANRQERTAGTERPEAPTRRSVPGPPGPARELEQDDSTRTIQGEAGAREPSGEGPGETLALGRQFLHRGNVEGARRAFQQGVGSGDPDVASRAAFALGHLLWKLGDFREARAFLLRSVDSKHQEVAPRAALALGQLLLERDDPTNAREFFQRAIDSGHLEAAPWAALNLAEFYRKNGDHQDARRFYERAILSGHSDVAPTAALGLARMLAERGNVQGSMAAYQRVIESGHPLAVDARRELEVPNTRWQS